MHPGSNWEFQKACWEQTQLPLPSPKHVLGLTPVQREGRFFVFLFFKYRLTNSGFFLNFFFLVGEGASGCVVPGLKAVGT